MAKLSTWVHGNSVVTEHPADGALQQVDGRAWTDVVGYHLGWGAGFQGTGGNQHDTWFHFSVPSPVQLNLASTGGFGAAPMFLDKFFVLFTTQGICGVDAVDAWDANTRIFHWASPDGAVNMQGDWSRPTTRGPDGITDRNIFSNIFTLAPPSPRGSQAEAGNGARPHVQFGLGISVHVNFGRAGDKVFFHAAGADWASTPTPGS